MLYRDNSAHLHHQRVEGGFGLVEIDKPDNGGNASSISSSSFNTQKELARVTGFTDSPITPNETEYITMYGSEEQKENQK